MGVAMAGMLYSKYHGLLLILFSLIPNLFLLKRPMLYVASLVGVALFFPHLYWQYDNDFASFTYHLSGRNKPFEWSYVTDYFFNIIVTNNPFLWILLVPLLFWKRLRGRFETTCYVIIWSFWLFFMLSTGRGYVQPQWMIITALPLIYLLFTSLSSSPQWEKKLRVICMVSLPVLLFIRLSMVIELLPGALHEFHRNMDYYSSLHSAVGGKPVLFPENYKEAALYAYENRTRKVSSVTTYNSRSSQFDLWRQDTAFHGQTVFLIGGNQPLKHDGFVTHGKFIEDFQPLPSLSPRIIDATRHTDGKSLRLTYTIENPLSRTVKWDTAKNNILLLSRFFNDRGEVSFVSCDTLRGAIFPKQQMQKSVVCLLPDTGVYTHVQLHLTYTHKGLPVFRNRAAPVALP